MDNIAIYKRLKQHYNLVKNQGYNILFIALQGSQNYNLATEESDVDSMIVIIPSLDDIVSGKPPINKVIQSPLQEQIEIMDIRYFRDQLIKQNTQFLQILFTDYKIVNSGYRDYVNYLYNMNEELTHINRIALFRNIIGIGQACNRRFYKKEQDMKARCKQLYHLIRLDYLFKCLTEDKSYNESLFITEDSTRAFILKCKQADISYKEACELNDLYLQKLMNRAFDVNIANSEYNETIVTKLNNIVKQILAYTLKQEMQIVVKEVNLEQYPNVYFTSDCHFGHTNIIKYEQRDMKMNISGTMEHDQKLISNWNSIVKPKDLVIILGDFSFHKPEITMSILRQLNGHKVLIEGNHDCNFLKNKSFDRSLFEEIAEYKEYHYRGYHLCLMHYPIHSFKHMDKKPNPYIHVHGHIHSYPSLECKHSYNAGVDVNDYKPVHINTIIQKCLDNKEGKINGS